MKPAFVFIVVGMLIASAERGNCADTSICNPGSDVVFSSRGKLLSCTLKDNYTDNGVTCSQLNTITFYESGKLRNCSISNGATIGKIPCAQNGPFSFYESGNLKSCVLSETVQIDGKTPGLEVKSRIHPPPVSF